MYFVGIDNGKQGGIAVINEEEKILLCIPMPLLNNEYDLETIKYKITNEGANYLESLHVGLEVAHVMPHHGAKSNFTIGHQYGQIEAILKLSKTPYETVRAQTWQKKIFQGIRAKDTKEASAIYCTRKYPEYAFKATPRCKVIHDGMTDALCLAIYIKRLKLGEL